MKWIGLLTISTAAYVATVTADCQPNLGGNCGDSSRPRDQNCCQVGYCQPWNSGYYQCITAPAKCPAQETDIDYAGNDIKTVYGLQPSQCCDTCAATANCKAYTFVNQNPDGKTACYLKTSSAGRVEKKGAVSAELVITTPPPPPPNCPVQEVDTDYYGNDIKTVNSVTQAQCCDACGSTDKCVGYSYVPSTSSCYLKSSTTGKVAKSGVISGQVTTTKPPPPPPNCPVQDIDTDYYGNDLKTVNSVTQAQCCDACGTTDKCVGYSYVPSTKSCYLKSSTAGKVAKAGVISGQLPATPPPPPNCPVQEVNVDYYGNDIKTVNSVTQAQCCDACGTTDKCVGYSYVPSTSSCYLKSSTAGKVSKAGVISGQVTITTPPPPPNCPVQELNTDYYGNDLKTVNGVSQSECCDSCGTTTNCVAYSYVASTKSCYLKSSTAGRVTKAGVVSGQIKYIPPPPNCPTQELNIDYVDNDIKTVRGVTYGGCCDACGATSGCRAFVYVEQNPDGKSACYLKSAAGTKVSKTGAIAGLYACPTPVLGSCGSSSTGPLCCPTGSFCEPWNPGYYQCIPVPDAAKCPKIVAGVDFYGGDIDVQYGLLPGTCCDACNANKDCTVFTFVNDAPGGKSACYLKNKVVEQRAKANAISGYKAA